MAARAQNLEAGMEDLLYLGVRNLKMRPHGTAVVPDLIGRLWTERSRPLICLLWNGQAIVTVWQPREHAAISVIEHGSHICD
jgi:hypothetical protein